MSQSKAITILSGGLDSMVSTAIAVKKHKIVLALTFDYGQRAARREIEAAQQMCRLWKISHKIIKLPWLKETTNTSLVNRAKKLPIFSASAFAHPSVKTLSAVWVPNRNAIFINIAAAFAEAFCAEVIVTGFNREEGATFPDNSRRFVRLINKALKQSTLKRPRVVSYTQDMNKAEIIRRCKQLKLPVQLCWPCYRGGRKLCGRCESCARFFRALEKS